MNWCQQLPRLPAPFSTQRSPSLAPIFHGINQGLKARMSEPFLLGGAHVLHGSASEGETWHRNDSRCSSAPEYIRSRTTHFDPFCSCQRCLCMMHALEAHADACDHQFNALHQCWTAPFMMVPLPTQSLALFFLSHPITIIPHFRSSTDFHRRKHASTHLFDQMHVRACMWLLVIYLPSSQAKINSRVVRRTVGLLHDKGQAEAHGYHPHFAYSETQHAEDEVAARRVSWHTVCICLPSSRGLGSYRAVCLCFYHLITYGRFVQVPPPGCFRLQQ